MNPPIEIDKFYNVSYDELKKKTSFLSSSNIIADALRNDWREVFDYCVGQQCFEGVEPEPQRYRKFTKTIEGEGYVIKIPIDKKYDELGFIDALIQYVVLEGFDYFQDALEYFEQCIDWFGE